MTIQFSPGQQANNQFGGRPDSVKVSQPPVNAMGKSPDFRGNPIQRSGTSSLLQFWQSQERCSNSRVQLSSWSSSSKLHEVSSVDHQRGFMPSDVTTDPAKREFLTDLSKKIFSPAVKSKSLLQLHKRTRDSSFISSNHRMDQKACGTSIFDKVMTTDPEIDSGSLKRRNPREMYSDSSFYLPKFHLSIAEQVEMAHRLSSSLYNDGTKLSKGQEMYLKRMKKSGKWIHSNVVSGTECSESEVSAHHNKVPNLKLVMNPEGKLHDWTDLPESELPDLQHFLVNSPSSDISNKSSSLIESGKVRCKPNDPLWFKHDSQPQQSHQESPKASSFVSSFRQVFDSRRGLFEKARQISDKTNPIKVQNIHNMPQPPIITIKSSPLPKQHIPPIARSGIVETRPTDPPSSPSVPRRASSRQVCAQYRKKLVDTNEQLEDRSRPPLRSFFG